MPVRRCIIYGRISQDRDGEGAIKVDDQIAQCRNRADRQGWEVIDVCRDDGISASSGKRRPGFEQVLEYLRNHQVDTVLVWKVDRLYRRLKDYLRIYEIANEYRSKFDIRTPEDGEVACDMATAAGRLVASMFASVAAYEVELAGERRQAAFRRQAQRGKVHRHIRALGYGNDGVTVDRNEAAVLQQAAEMVLAGDSMTKAASYVTDALRQYQDDPEAFKVSSRTLRDVLLAHRIVGKRAYYSGPHKRRRPSTIPKSRYQPEFLTDAEWEPILDIATWTALHQQLNAPLKPDYVPRSTTRSAMLSGLLFCGSCGHGLNLAGKNYACPSPDAGGCGSVAISRRMIEDYYRSALGRLIEQGSDLLQIRPPKTPTMSEIAIEEAKAELKQQRVDLLEHAKTELSTQDLILKLAELEERIEKVGEPDESEYYLRLDEKRLKHALQEWQSTGDPADETVREVIQTTIRHTLVTKARTRGRAVDFSRIHTHWGEQDCHCTETDRPRTVVPIEPL